MKETLHNCGIGIGRKVMDDIRGEAYRSSNPREYGSVPGSRDSPL